MPGSLTMKGDRWSGQILKTKVCYSLVIIIKHFAVTCDTSKQKKHEIGQ